MPKKPEQFLISIGATNPYLHAVLGLLGLTGLLYVTQAEKAYDPAVIAMPFAVSWTDYLGLLLGALVVYVGFLAALKDRVLSLYVQYLGVAIQVTAMISIAAGVLYYSTAAKGAFELLVAVIFSSMHIVKLRQLARAIFASDTQIKVGRKVIQVQQEIKDTGDSL